MGKNSCSSVAVQRLVLMDERYVITMITMGLYELHCAVLCCTRTVLYIDVMEKEEVLGIVSYIQTNGDVHPQTSDG